MKILKTLLKGILILLIVSAGIIFLGYAFYQNQTEKEVKSAEKEILAAKEKLAGEALEKETTDTGKKFNLAQTITNYNEELYLREKTLARSSDIKGVYMTKYIGNAGLQDSAARYILDNIKKLLDETELNGIVIDAKDENGFKLSDSLKLLIQDLKNKNIWVIARMVGLRDSSQIKLQPELYLKKEDGSLWQDDRGYYWLDPASFQVQKYIIDLAKQAIDFGFDEIQFDYVRFPDKDSDVVYPIYDGEKAKHEIIGNFYLEIRDALRAYKPNIILSVDLFGEAATRSASLGIGQALGDDVAVFDYISPMLYPSHFFYGFEVAQDMKRNLPHLYFPYNSENISEVVSNHPYDVVYRAILSASDFVSFSFTDNLKKGIQPNCLTKGEIFLLYCPKPKIRPWLQDFNLKQDTSREIIYDAAKVRAQIKAAEDAGASGWLLWSPSNIYTEDALK